MKREKGLKNCVRLLEERLMRPEIRRSKDSVDRLLAEDFHEFRSSGQIANKQEAIQTLQEETPCRFTLEDFHITVLSPGVVLATYHSTCTGPLGRSKHSLRSSIWIKQNGEWQLAFHQATRCERVAHELPPAQRIVPNHVFASYVGPRKQKCSIKVRCSTLDAAAGQTKLC